MQQIEERLEKVEAKFMENPSQKDFIRFETEVLISLASRKPHDWAALVVQCAENIRAVVDRKPDEYLRGFLAGCKAVAHDRNTSGCTCIFDEYQNIIEVCKIHADWRKQAEDRVHIQVLKRIIEMLIKVNDD